MKNRLSVSRQDTNKEAHLQSACGYNPKDRRPCEAQHPRRIIALQFGARRLSIP